ncbi:MAG: hypothetical protein DWQ05_13020 [Calditrichaeota bacterium]|nr:MAG: hypothetical protein DWQ05_13020 [Calditrichota bacterium]
MADKSGPPQIEKIISASKPGVGHTAFEIRFIWWGLFFTLFGGLALGALSVAGTAFERNFIEFQFAYTQLHGHLQLVGWTGCFIIPISLHFIPRFAGIPLENKKAPSIILVLVILSLILRYTGSFFLPYCSGIYFKIGLWILFLSAALFLTGILYYIRTLFRIMTVAKIKMRRPALPPVAPFLMMVLAGWFIYAVLNFILMAQLIVTQSILLDRMWNEFAIEIFLAFVLFPISFSFAIRTFPLYFRLPAADWPVRQLAFIYLISVLVYLIPQIPIAQLENSNVAENISAIGVVVRNFIVLWLVWKLDIITRLQKSWLQKQEAVFSETRRPTRPGMPDYGEYGRFELLIYAAFIWLVLGVICQIVNEFFTIFYAYKIISDDLIRHAYLLGFITNLILGMAPRMIPAFMGVKWIYKPELVTFAFIMINIAIAGRILPLLAPNLFREIGTNFYGFSGVFAMGAILCLWIILYKSQKRAGK